MVSWKSSLETCYLVCYNEDSVQTPIHHPVPPCSSFSYPLSALDWWCVRAGWIRYCSKCELSPSTDRLLKVSPPADSESKEMAEKLARFVAESGPEVEAMTFEHNRDNPAFRSVSRPLLLLLTLTRCALMFTVCVSSVAAAVSYTTTTVRFTVSTKRGCRSIAPLREPRAPLPQPRQQPPQPRRGWSHCSRRPHRLWTTPPRPAVRTQNLCLSNERGRAGGGLKTTRSTCPCPPWSFPRRSTLQTPMRRLSPVRHSSGSHPWCQKTPQ